MPELSVAENLSLGREPVRAGLVRWDAVRDAGARARSSWSGSTSTPAGPCDELGIGQQQLVEIAKALAKKRAHPRPRRAHRRAHRGRRGARSCACCASCARAASTCIYISHRLDEVFALADRITVLRDGRSVARRAAAELTSERVIALMVGREVEARSSRGRRARAGRRRCCRSRAGPSRTR